MCLHPKSGQNWDNSLPDDPPAPWNVGSNDRPGFSGKAVNYFVGWCILVLENLEKADFCCIPPFQSRIVGWKLPLDFNRST